MANRIKSKYLQFTRVSQDYPQLTDDRNSFKKTLLFASHLVNRQNTCYTPAKSTAMVFSQTLLMFMG